MKNLDAKVTEVGERVHTVETKINVRFKVFETTMQKSFIEQVTRMEGRLKKHIGRCEKQTAEVAKKVDTPVSYTHLRYICEDSRCQHASLRSSCSTDQL